MSTRSDWFPHAALAAAAVALAATVGVAATRATPDPAGASAPPPGAPAAPAPTGPGAAVDLDDGAVADPDADPAEVLARSAAAMGAVTSVEFHLRRTGTPVFVDQFESIALDAAVGRFTVPTRAAATLDVTVDGNLRTRIGAVAIGPEVWMSNPVTGRFETLPEGYDIDPSRFFDPVGGWQPLLAHLTDVSLVGVDDRGGQRWHLHGVAPAADVENITVGLVRGQDVAVDVWVHPGTHLVTALELDTATGTAGTTHWEIELARYGEAFTIEPPEGV